MLAGSVMSQGVTATRLPVGPRVSWAGVLTSSGAVRQRAFVFWPGHTYLSLGLLAKYCLASPAWDPREGSNGSLPFSIKSRKGQPILSAIFYLLERSQSIGSHPGEGYPRPFLRSRDQWRYHRSCHSGVFPNEISKLRTAFKNIARFPLSYSSLPSKHVQNKK